jgi:hypothetical protein
VPALFASTGVRERVVLTGRVHPERVETTFVLARGRLARPVSLVAVVAMLLPLAIASRR